MMKEEAARGRARVIVLSIFTAFSVFTASIPEGIAQRQELDEDATRRLYTSTTVTVAVLMPVIIINHISGNLYDDEIMLTSTTSTELIELTDITLWHPDQLDLARAIVSEERTELAEELVLGDGPLLRSLRDVTPLRAVRNKNARAVIPASDRRELLRELYGGSVDAFLSAYASTLVESK